MNKLLDEYLKYRKENKTVGLIIFKPRFLDEHLNYFCKLCSDNNMLILNEGKILLTKNQVIALYPNIFSDSLDDYKYGFLWKKDTIDYLISGDCYYYLVCGSNYVDILTKFKYSLRHKYNKVSYPEIELNRNDFKKIVIENIIHVVDEHEIQNILWLFFYTIKDD